MNDEHNDGGIESNVGSTLGNSTGGSMPSLRCGPRIRGMIKKDSFPFPLEKILRNVTIDEYCASAGTKLEDYNLKGIHIRSTDKRDNLIEYFRFCVPQDTEVVLGYRSSIVTAASFWKTIIIQDAYGTALIPKKKE